jgi:hypothetical protein
MARLGDVVEHQRTLLLLLHTQLQLAGMGGDGVHVANIDQEPGIEMSLKVNQMPGEGWRTLTISLNRGVFLPILPPWLK